MSVWIERQAMAIAVGLAACMPARADPMFAEVSLNGVNTGMVVTFERSGAALFAPWGDLKRLGLQLTPPADANDDTSAELARIAGLRYSVDAARQVVFLDAEPALLPHRTITPSAAPILPPDRAVWGAALDYGAHVQGAAGWLGGQSRVFGPLGVLSNSFVARSSGGGTFRRLETQFVIDDYAGARSLTIGDFISDALPSRRAVRAGGLHLSTEPTLRPDIFAAPLLQVSGEASLPSSVELLVDGVRRYQANVDPGRFTLRTPPMVNSRGDLSLVVTDALGRQTVTTQPFYSSSSLLQPGVNVYSLDLGALREDYAGADDHYGEAFVAFTLRRGVSKALTLEAHGEGTGHGRAGGLGAVAALGQAGLVSAAIDASDARAGAGARLRMAVRRDAPAYSLWLSYEERFGNFSELGRRETGSIAGRDGQMGASLRSARWGDFSASYVVRDTGRGRYGLATAAWSRGFGRSQVFANVSLADDRGGGRGLSFGLTTPLGGNGGLAAIGADTQGGGHLRAQADAAPPDQQRLGWRIGGEQALATGATRIDAEVRGISPSGDLAVGVAADRSGASLRAYVSGSVVWLGGRLRLTRQGGGGLALIETGEPGVEVKVENRLGGRTGRDGTLLVANLPANTPTRIEVVAESVALAADIEVEDRVVRPPRAGAVRVSLPVRRRANAQLQVLDAIGQPLPIGAPVRLNGRPAGVVGFDSWIYLKDVRRENVIEIEQDGGHCQVRLALTAPPDAPLPPQTCAPRDAGGLRRINAVGAEPRHGGQELLSDDEPSGLWGLQRDGPRR